ncbi:MAG: hypothetical protein ACR2NM_11750 [Bythopirellula sp.]
MSAPILRWIGFIVSLSVTVNNASAASPSLAFDFGSTAKCREVVREDASELYPDEKLIELKLRISVHLLAGKIGDVEEVRIEISDCDSRIHVESFSPHTRLESDYSEDITVTKTTEKSKSLGASLGGEAPVPIGDVVAHVLPSVNGGLTNRDVVTEKQVRRAPQYAAVASGTIGGEHGVFFKLRSSPQTTLEGAHELTVRFVVPDNWRGDSLRVCCTATGQKDFLWITQEATWARTCAPIAIYLAGDAAARTAAEEHVGRKSS